MNRLLHILSVALITAGLVVLADVATTLAWREPVSSVYGSIQQHKAAGQLADLEDAFPTRADLRRVARLNGPQRKVGALADLFASRVHTGQAIGRIVIPDIDLDVIAVQGTDTASLQKGPGHYPDTPFPGQRRNNGVRGPPNDVPGPVPTPRRPATGRPDRGRDAVRQLHLSGSGHAGRLPVRPGDHPPGRLRPPGAHGLPSAVLAPRSASSRSRGSSGSASSPPAPGGGATHDPSTPAGYLRGPSSSSTIGVGSLIASSVSSARSISSRELPPTAI